MFESLVTSARTVAQGGGQPSYLNIEKAMCNNPNSVILRSRLPPGCTILCDLRLWTCAEIDTWVRHLLDGQDGILPADQRFGWRSVPQPKGSPELLVHSFKPLPLDRKAVPWTHTELLYAQLIEETLSKDSTHPPNTWDGLPPVCTNHIYSPYSCYTSCLGYSLKLKDDLNTNISYWKDIQQYAQTS
jgi:hypothetical protein